MFVLDKYDLKHMFIFKKRTFSGGGIALILQEEVYQNRRQYMV